MTLIKSTDGSGWVEAHFNTKHGLNKTRIQRVWKCMKQRCYVKTHKDYAKYGGRGITVCDAWKDSKTGLAQFFADMGHPKDGFSLDRVDNSKGYYKENCRWATSMEQGQNRSSTKLCAGTVEAIRFMAVWYGITYRSIGKHFGISGSQVEKVVNGKQWANVIHSSPLLRPVGDV